MSDASVTKPSALQYRFDGPEDAPVLVLGPSLGATWHMWDRQVPELTQRWRVFRFDLPGHGGAPAHAAESVAELTTRLLATLDELGVARFGYAGCALGGAIGAELALRHPARIGSLVLVACAARFGTADEFRRRGVVVRSKGLDPLARTAPERWFTPRFAAAQPAITEWAVEMVRTIDPGCYIAACEALATFDVGAELDRIGVPTLVLVGSEDQVTGQAQARTLVAGIPDARLAVVPDAAHLAPVEQPAAVTDLLVRHFGTAWHTPDASVTGQFSLPAAVVPASAPASANAVSEPPPAAPVAELTSGSSGRQENPLDAHQQGLKIRREVLGDAHVDRELAAADDFSAPHQDFVTRYAWGEIWARPGLDRRTRSCVTLTALAAGGHTDELAAHVRAALRVGLTPDEIREVLLQTAVYCGVPVADRAFKVAQRVIHEETTPEG